MSVTADQAALFDRLMRDGATVLEATEVVRLSTMIDLAHVSTAWMHERRGRGGKWVSGGGGGEFFPPLGSHGLEPMEHEGIKIVPRSVPLTKPPAPTKAAAAAEMGGLKPRGVVALPDLSRPATQEDLQALADQMEERFTNALRDMTAESSKRIEGKSEARARLMLLQVKAQEQKHRSEKARKKFAIEAGITIGGLVLAVVEGLIGAPGLSQILAAMSGPVIQAIMEHRKKL